MCRNIRCDVFCVYGVYGWSKQPELILVASLKTKRATGQATASSTLHSCACRYISVDSNFVLLLADKQWAPSSLEMTYVFHRIAPMQFHGACATLHSCLGCSCTAPKLKRAQAVRYPKSALWCMVCILSFAGCSCYWWAANSQQEEAGAPRRRRRAEGAYLLPPPLCSRSPAIWMFSISTGQKSFWFLWIFSVVFTLVCHTFCYMKSSEKVPSFWYVLTFESFDSIGVFLSLKCPLYFSSPSEQFASHDLVVDSWSLRPWFLCPKGFIKAALLWK